MPARNGAWVRDKKRPKASHEQVDPTAALLPMLNYLGCRPNPAPPQRRRGGEGRDAHDDDGDLVMEEEGQDYGDIEIVTPERHNRRQRQQGPRQADRSSNHPYTQSHSHSHPHTNPRPRSQNRTPASLARPPPRRTGAGAGAGARPNAVHDALSRPYPSTTTTRHTPLSYSSVGQAPRPLYAGGGGVQGRGATLGMSRAMAVNLGAITPLAM